MCRKTSKKCIWFFKDMSYLHTCSQESLINSCKLTVCHLIRWWGGCQCVRGTYWFEASVDETAQRVHRGPSGRKRRLHVWPARNCQLARCVELMSTTCTEFDFFHIWIVSRNSTATKQALLRVENMQLIRLPVCTLEVQVHPKKSLSSMSCSLLTSFYIKL